MTVFIVETYVVKPGKEGELASLLQRIAGYKNEEIQSKIDKED